MPVEIREERELPSQMSRLVEIGLDEGFAFVERFVTEWEGGQNRFDRRGEVSLFAYIEGVLVGFGGLNLDPYQSHPSVGRVRHVYVEPGSRGRGVGSALVRELVRRARPAFATLRLTAQQAAPFYEQLGFAPVSEHKATHKMTLGPGAARDGRQTGTRDTYDAIGAEFLENSRDRSELRVWLDRFASSLPSGTLVLDLGGGPGFDSSELRTRGLESVCVDLSLGMLRAGAREFPGPRIQADIRSLPFASGSVRGVWANASLLHLPRSQAGSALLEIRRVLRPPAMLHVSVKRGTGSAWESERYGKPRWFQYWSDPDLDKALGTAGFRVHAAWVHETAQAIWLVRLASVENPDER